MPLQEHSFSIDVDASPEEVWEVFWYRGNDRPKNKIGTIDILHPGDEVGNGLVHNRLSRDNDTLLAAIEGGIRWHRKRAGAASTSVDAATGEGSGRSDQP